MGDKEELNLNKVYIINLKQARKKGVQFLNEYRTGKISGKQLNSMGYILNIIIGALKVEKDNELEQRIEALEGKTKDEFKKSY